MERIDFYNKKLTLHNEMYDAIVELMRKHNVNELDLRDYDVDNAYVCNAAIIPAIEEMVIKIRLKVFLEVTTNGYDEDDDVWLCLTDDVLLASFDTLYDAVYQILEGK